MAEDQILQVVKGLLEMVGVAGMENLLPSDLSTGMKRSVAIARALASQPEAVLYDEPTTMVDPLMAHLLGSLIERLKQQNRPVRILALGPLTNLAEALQRSPSVSHAIDEVVIMGGAIRVPGNLGDGGLFKTTNKTAEWNMFVDPLAALIVFRSGIRIRLIALDATNTVPIGAEPLELALLPVVESAFEPYAYSRASASGLWQFIPGTGSKYGLKQDWWYDGRRDIVESTRAALDYLQALHDEFDGDWLLAIAAYNCGEALVERAVEMNRAAGRPVTFW